VTYHPSGSHAHLAREMETIQTLPSQPINPDNQALEDDIPLYYDKTGFARIQVVPPIECTRLRIRPTSWHISIRMRCEILGYPVDVPDWLRPDSPPPLSEIPSASAHAAMRALQSANQLGWDTAHIRNRLLSLLRCGSFDVQTAGQGGRFGDPLLLAAVRLRDRELVEQLLDLGASWKEENRNRQTALDLIGPCGDVRGMPRRLIGLSSAPALPNSAICSSSFDASDENDDFQQDCGDVGQDIHDFNRTRLDAAGPCFKAQDDTVRQWLQYSFPEPMRIVAVQTLGDSSSHERVEAYRLEYVGASGQFRPYRDDESYKLTGNIERQFMHENRIVPIACIRLRILPETWVGHLAMRVDLLGFTVDEFESITDEEAREALLRSCE